jgi:fructose-bisphosphate aldolase class II
MMEICLARYQEFGTAGQASKIKPLSLEAMHVRYDSSALDPRVN